MIQMYDGVVNSIETVTTGAINATDTIINVLDETRIPEAPNILVLGSGASAETVKLVEKNGSVLTVERGLQGIAKSWASGTLVARNFTEYDHRAFKENIEELGGSQGDLTLLETVEQSNLVGAVNEVNSQLAQIINNPYAQMTKLMSQSILDNTISKVLFSNHSSNKDTDNMLDLVNSRFICNTSGRYILSGFISFLLNATGRREVFIYKNGSLLTLGGVVIQNAVTGGSTIVHFQLPVQLSENDHLEIYARQTSGNALDVVGASDGFRTLASIMRVGD